MTEAIQVSFPGGKRVDAQVGAFTIRTDQPTEGGGEGSAPAPYDLFLASLATCAGIYVLGFCQARGIPTDGLALTQRHELDPDTHLPTRSTCAYRTDSPRSTARPSSASRRVAR
jgi:ribosomal protein S12 methylthiotransferase accessory factor